MTKDTAVAVLIMNPAGIPLIRDPKKPAPVYWKLPGGRGTNGETPEMTAVREIEEEIGLTLTEDDLFVIHEEDRGSHTLVLFKAQVPSVEGLRKEGNEGEEVKLFPAKEILGMSDFFPNHRAIVADILKSL